MLPVPRTHIIRAFYYELAVDGDRSEKQKSSGLLMCTGTGSTAWMMSMEQLTRDRVRSILMLAAGPDEPPPADERVATITEAYNQRLRFAPDAPFMYYVVRDPIDNGIFAARYRRCVSRPWRGVRPPERRRC